MPQLPVSAIERGLREAGAIAADERLLEVTGRREVEGHSGTQSTVERASAVVQRADGLRRAPVLVLKTIAVDGVAALAGKAAHARAQTLRSFENEWRFLLEAAPALARASRSPLRVPTVYAAERAEGSSYSYAMESIPWSRRYLLNAEDLRRALSAAARLHASFHWLPEGGRESLRSALWEKGGWWTHEKRPPEQAARLREYWAAIVSAFGFASAAAAELAPRLHARLPSLARALDRLWAGEDGGLRTLVHGDYKAGNILFGEGYADVAAVDFQWTGMGPPIADVAYLILSSSELEALQGAGEGPYLEHYASELRAALPPEARPEAPSAASLAAQFDLCVLDYLRATAPYISQLSEGPSSCEAVARHPGASNIMVQKRSAAHVALLADRALAALPRLEALQPPFESPPDPSVSVS
eukprot:tig00000821_g4507.t1